MLLLHIMDNNPTFSKAYLTGLRLQRAVNVLMQKSLFFVADARCLLIKKNWFYIKFVFQIFLSVLMT